jgi:hypothetical protein
MKKHLLIPAVLAYVSGPTIGQAQEAGLIQNPDCFQEVQRADGSIEQTFICPVDPPDPVPPPPPQQQCPVALPVPATQFSVQCKAQQNSSRCGGGLSSATCSDQNVSSYNMGLLTLQAYNWLQANGYCAVNGGFATILSICPVGCFEENTQILAQNDRGANEWLAAKTISLDHRLVSMTSDSLLSSPQVSGRSIERMSVGPEENDLYVFAMTNRRTLRVTAHHVMVLSDGRVLEAEKVTQGESFVGVDGRKIGIRSISREPTRADVYNFAVNAETPQEHVIAAEGVLVGDLDWQSTLIGELESIRLRQ